MIWGLLRIKNEARWIARVLAAIRPACDDIIVLDDHSDDGTPEICEAEGASVVRSPFVGINETRDKNHLLGIAQTRAALNDWCVMVDGDEVLMAEDADVVRRLAGTEALGYTFRVLYCWDREDQIRVDGVYRAFTRPSMFRLASRDLRFRSTAAGGNFHCSSVPQQMIGKCKESPVRLLHLGYLHREDRLRKFEFYRRIDSGNSVEDGYLHIVQGDIPEVPASARLRHAGPLELRAFQE